MILQALSTLITTMIILSPHGTQWKIIMKTCTNKSFQFLKHESDNK